MDFFEILQVTVKHAVEVFLLFNIYGNTQSEFFSIYRLGGHLGFHGYLELPKGYHRAPS